jgi:hypothetical protein
MPKYSIIVPTVSRAALLHETLRSLLATSRHDIEVIVSNNASTDLTAEIIQTFADDPRLVAVKTDKRLSMTAHWEFARGFAKGDYLIINGDDDCLAPDLLEKLDSTIEHFNAPLISWHCGLYHHPDYDAEGTPNTFFFRAGHSGMALTIDPVKLLENYARLDFEFFPETTRVCLRRDLAERVIDKTGRLFWPAWPDFSPSTLCLADLRENEPYVYLDAMLSFGGRSKSSNAASFARGGDNARVRSFMTEFDGEDVFPHHPLKLPFYYNGHAQALSLAKHFYPERLRGIDMDPKPLLRTYYEEMRGVRHTALLPPDTEARFAAYLSTADVATQAAAREIDALVQAPGDNPRHSFSLRQLIPFKARLRQMMGRPVPALRGATVTGAEAGFANAGELVEAWHTTILPRDHMTLASVERAHALQMLGSAARVAA